MLVRSGRAAAMLSAVGVLGASWSIGSGALLQSATAAPVAAAANTSRTADGAGQLKTSAQRFIVTFDKNRVMPAANRHKTFERLAKAHDTTVQSTHLTGLGNEVIQLDKSLAQSKVDDFIAAMNKQQGVAQVQPDQIVHAADVPNDPDFSQQWDLADSATGINVGKARSRSTGAGVTVGVVDSGITQHPDLTANVSGGYDFISDPALARDGNARDDNPSDEGDYGDSVCRTGNTPSDWHGTHVAGTIAAVTNNGTGVAGVAGDAKIEPLRVLGACGGGYLSDIADAMLWGAGESVPGMPENPNPVQILNLSIGGFGSCSPVYQNAIDKVRARGVTVVAAAGNSGEDASTSSPASCNGVIAVGASNSAGALTDYSNYGQTVDVTAPGDEILSTVNEGTNAPAEAGYGTLSGTSMAAPHVAGTAALLKSLDPSLTPDQIEERIKATARPMPQPCSQGCGAGLLDAAAAVGANEGDTATQDPSKSPSEDPSDSPTDGSGTAEPTGTATETPSDASSTSTGQATQH